ncbi:MAG TPA: hypothetical protein PKA82_17700 [Pyrinomonadaceae bacterium]|nr:hypothetical protein [Pyrinomonadaceae bacterium]
METKDWILVVGPIVGVLIGGLITSFAKWIEIQRNRAFSLRDQKLARLEAIHRKTTEFLLSLNRLPAEAMAMCSEHISEQERRLAIAPLVRQFADHSAELGSLILMHAPNAGEMSSIMMRKADEAGNSIFHFMNLHLQTSVLPEERKRYFDMMRKSVLELADPLVKIQIILTEDVRLLLDK